MSYDINNYVFKGVPISEFVACLGKDPVVMCLASEDNFKKFLVVDDALVASLNETKKSLDYAIDGSPIEACKIATFIARESMGVSGEGPRSLFLHTILRACGISVGDHLSADSELGYKFLSSFNLHDFKAYPLVEMHGETLSMGVIEIPNEFEAFVCIASKMENWNLIEDPRRDPESYEISDPALTLDLEKNIEWALESPTSSEYDIWRESYCAMLINLFIKPGEEYVEEDDCWTSDVGVVSTRHGDVHQCGGMEDREMYLVVSGDDMSGYDEEGWSDPEKETPTAYRKLKGLLFGDPDYPTNKYTPQFGG